jgi:hypothetical protein
MRVEGIAGPSTSGSIAGAAVGTTHPSDIGSAAWWAASRERLPAQPRKAPPSARRPMPISIHVARPGVHDSAMGGAEPRAGSLWYRGWWSLAGIRQRVGHRAGCPDECRKPNEGRQMTPHSKSGLKCMAAFTGALTYGATFWPSLFANTGGAVVSSGINSVTQDGASSATSSGSIAGAAAGTALGFPIGAAMQGGLNAAVNPWYRSGWQEMGYTIQRWVGRSPLPGILGAAFGSAGQEIGNAVVNVPSAPSPGRSTRGGQ